MRSTTFLFTTLCTSIQNFGVLRVQTMAQQNEFEPAGAAPPWRPGRRAFLRLCADRGRTPSPGSRAPGRLETRVPRASPPFALYVRRAPEWTAGPSVALPVHAPAEERHTTAASSLPTS
jgi:hypothetical protein